MIEKITDPKIIAATMPSAATVVNLYQGSISIFTPMNASTIDNPYFR